MSKSAGEGERARKGPLIFMGLLIVICICFFSLSINLHSIVTKTIERSDVSGALTGKLLDETFSELGIDNQGLLSDVKNYIKESEEIRQIADKLMKEMLLCVEKGRTFEKLDFSKELDQLISGMAEQLGQSNSALIEVLKNQAIKELRSREEAMETVINGYASRMLEQLQNMSGTAGMVLKGYALLQSVWFQWGMATALVILTVFTFVLSRRFSRGCLYLGVETVLAAALLLLVVRPLGNALVGRLSEGFLGMELELYMRPLTTTGQAVLIAGAVGIVIGVIGKLRPPRA